MPKRLLKLPGIYMRHFRDSPFYVLLNTMAAISIGIMFLWIIGQNRQLHHQSDVSKELAIKAKKLAVSTSDLTRENAHLLKIVQNNRRDLVYKACRDQNIRHSDSLKALKSLLHKSGVSQPKRDSAYKQTKVLINALVPYRNCVKLANTAIKPKTKPLPGSK